VDATLPELVEIPEALSAASVGLPGALLPICGIFGRPPRSGDSAVNDTAQIVPVDFVYAAAIPADGVTDPAQAVRDRLDLLTSRLLTNYRQGGACNATTLVETPVEIANLYQQYFKDQGETAFTAMVATLEFTVLESLL
jgi:hypothetical protein